MKATKSLLWVLLLTLVLATSGVVSAAPPAQDEDGQEYTVQADDWLSKIADKFYGDVLAYPTIMDATNAKAAEDESFAVIDDPNVIEVGQKLWIPAAPAGEMMAAETPADTSTTEGAMADADSPTIELRLLETTDIHTNIMNYNYFSDAQDDSVGLVKTATLIKEARDEATNSLLIDNGDLIQGTPLGDYMARVKGLDDGNTHPVYKAMNTLDYEVGNIGNHEFNYGLDYLEAAIAGADFPYISANVDDAATGEPHFTPYIIKDYTFTDTDGNEQTLKVGYIGFVPPQIMQWDKANLEGLVTANDIVETAQEYVPQMKDEGADLVIAVPHSGLDVQPAKGGDENAVYYLSEVPDIDAILFGHAHRIFPGADFEDLEGVDNTTGTINGVPAVMPGFWANNLGVIDLTLQQVDGEWQVVASQSEARPISERVDNQTVSLVDSDQTIVDAVQEEHEATLDWIRQPFGETEAPINSFFALVQDDPSIQIVTDAQKWYVETLIQGTEYDGMPVLSAGAPFKAGRGGPDDFTDVPAGTIAFKNVADLYIYPNTLKVVELTGAEVREWLEMSAGQFNQIDPESTDEQPLINTDFPTYNFDVIDGVTYEIDVTQPARYDPSGNLVDPDAYRIVNLSYDGQPVDDGQTFVVATNNYRASGGGNFPGVTSDKIIIDAPDENRQVLANFVADRGVINPSADMNWSFTPINDTVKVTFRTTPAETAEEFAAAFDAISPTGQTDDDGFAVYTIDLAP
ncbi:MAG TPA: bifunctional 2',3'-cyclic-nucleotide 2'-phosphodiesterase/3'-nucleotidase [Anaerolineae bacterium]|nr:bifunctional 2',3'-cyclic-nucleotide 2'-phosphodiesterase/3'-nucleotidase [Anaerolineae bacterium]